MANRISILVALEGADEGLKRAINSAERSLGEFGANAKTAGDKAAAGMAEVKAGMSAFGDQVAKAKTQLLAFLTINWASGKVQEIVQIADAWNMMSARLKLATAGSREYLLPHPSEKVLRVRHRYPVVPWDWWEDVTPDFVLPVDTVARESLRWIDKPAYNRVFVAGQETGVLGQVTRTGTAGDVLAPMVVDVLITQAAAARQRGIAVLSDTGRQIEVTLRLPVLPETGIIEPGAFVAYQDGGVARLGIVRSTRIEAGLPEVWQTLGVQSHA